MQNHDGWDRISRLSVACQTENAIFFNPFETSGTWFDSIRKNEVHLEDPRSLPSNPSGLD